ncbi:hypothetical protein BGX33_012260 [Mortierella sp. NVP41]|nr:hypothetical protein BGX33_012260 [Mortierella sp. NVP41]
MSTSTVKTRPAKGRRYFCVPRSADALVAYTLLTLALCPSPSTAQIPFSPIPVRSPAFARTPTRLYIISGDAGGSEANVSTIPQFMSLDLTVPWSSRSPAWRRLAPGPHQYIFPAAASVDGKTLIAFHCTPTFAMRYDVESDTWTASNIKPAMAQMQGVGAVTDPDTGLVYLAAGFTSSRDAMSVYDFYTDTMASLFTLPPQDAVFRARAYYANVWSKHRKRIIYFGGYNTALKPIPTDNVITEFDPVTNTLSTIKTTGTAPPMRADHCMAANDDGTMIVIYGGRTSGSRIFTNDLYIYNTVTQTWRIGPPGLHRVYTACTISGNQLLIWGGLDQAQKVVDNSVLIFNIDSMIWTDQYNGQPVATNSSRVPSPPGATNRPGPSTPDSSSNSNESNVSVIVGGAVGGLAVILAAVLLGYFLRRKRDRPQGAALLSTRGDDDDPDRKRGGAYPDETTRNDEELQQLRVQLQTQQEELELHRRLMQLQQEQQLIQQQQQQQQQQLQHAQYLNQTQPYQAATVYAAPTPGNDPFRNVSSVYPQDFKNTHTPNVGPSTMASAADHYYLQSSMAGSNSPPIYAAHPYQPPYMVPSPTPSHTLVTTSAHATAADSNAPSRVNSVSAPNDNSEIDLDITVESVAEAIWALGGAVDTLPILQQFFDSVFRAVKAQLALSVDGKDVVLAPTLEIINGIVLAAQRACSGPPAPPHGSSPNSDASGPGWDLGIVFESMARNLFEPAWQLLSERRFRDASSGSGEDCSTSIRALIHAEEVLASFMPTLRDIGQHQSDGSLQAFLDLIILVVRMFDVVLLPLHLSPQCNEDAVHLVSGLLPLLQILKFHGQINEMSDMNGKLVSSLLATDLVERTIHSLQSTKSAEALKTCNVFIATLMCSGGIFHEPTQGDASPPAKSGDLLPDLDVLDGLIDPTGMQRRPLMYYKIMTGLQYSTEGLQEGGVLQSVLSLHLEEILVWLWSHEIAPHQGVYSKNLPDILLDLMMMFLMKEFRSEVTETSALRRRLLGKEETERVSRLISQYPAALCSVKGFSDIKSHIFPMDPGKEIGDQRLRYFCVVCSLIRSYARRLAFDSPRDESREIHSNVCACILDSAVKYCMSGHVVEAALGYTWEVLDSIIPLIKTSEGKESLVQWQGSFDMTKGRMPDGGLEVFPSLWETIQALVDAITSPASTNTNSNQALGTSSPEIWSSIADCAIEGMLLLHKANASFPTLVELTLEESRMLMVYYCLELSNVFVKGTGTIPYQPAAPSSDPRELVIVLVKWIVAELKKHRDIEVVEKLLGWSDLLLDNLLDSMLYEPSDTMVWKTLSVYKDALLSFRNTRPLAGQQGVRSSLPPASQKRAMDSWIQTRLEHGGHPVLINSVLRRWQGAATAVLERTRSPPAAAAGGGVGPGFGSGSNSTLHPQIQESREDSAIFAAQAPMLLEVGNTIADILSLTRMIVQDASENEHNRQVLDFGFKWSIVQLMGSASMTEIICLLRDLAASSSSPNTPQAGINASFVSSLAELDKIQVVCAVIRSCCAA